MSWQLLAGIGIGMIITLAALIALFYWATSGDGDK